MDKDVATPNLQEAYDTANNQNDKNVETTYQNDNVSTENQATGSDESSYDKYWEEDISLEDIAGDNSFDENQQGAQDIPDEQNLIEQVESEIQEDKSEKQTEGFVTITKPLKYKGNEITISSEDEAIALMQKGLDYEFKMNRIKPFRRAIKIIDDNNLQEDDIQALADIKSGKAEAINYLANKYNLQIAQDKEEDEIDLFGDSEPKKKQQPEYKPVVEKDSNSEIVDYFKEFSANYPKESGLVLETYNKLEPAFQLEVTQNIQLFQGFIKDVLDGSFARFYPETLKAKAINPSITWLQAYVGVAQNILKQSQTKTPSSTTVRKNKIKERKAVRNNSNDYDSAWDDEKSFEDFEKEIFKF